MKKVALTILAAFVAGAAGSIGQALGQLAAEAINPPPDEDVERKRKRRAKR